MKAPPGVFLPPSPSPRDLRSDTALAASVPSPRLRPPTARPPPTGLPARLNPPPRACAGATHVVHAS